MSNLEISRAQRLDQKVVELVPELSRGFAARLVEDGKVTVNGAVQTKAGYKLRDGDKVMVDYDIRELEQVPDINLPVLYEDDDCVVINKPVGVLAHSKGVFNPEATVASWLRERIADHKNANLKDSPLINNRAGIVHRLDRATSGVMICAKTPDALSWLQKQFATRNVQKTYAAVVKGALSPAEAIVDMPIERNPKAPATFRVGMQGKSAKTAYKTLATNDKYSLVELKPETGRTHQLRVHLNHLGHPIVGDTLYGGEPADRLYLHAERLELTILAGHERKVFTAPVPPEFSERVE
ncbi:MAG TPA: RluA family pseudouridine synthase [Candidatus Saccharimonadales bacterium]|nr:RluA family pseudouridine synthase [Candidatus Saccharimonadales bacterium]